jgi:hypothetical protein
VLFDVFNGGVPQAIRPSAACLNETTNVGSCFALFQLPLMPNRIDRYISFPANILNPNFPVAADGLTGIGGIWGLWTSYPPDAPQSVAAHSFVQEGGGSQQFGIYINSRDRTTSLPYSGIDRCTSSRPRPMRRRSSRGGGYDHDLIASFTLLVKTLRRGCATTLWAPMIEFADRRADGVCAFRHLQPKDFSRATATGRVIVGTVFRELRASGGASRAISSATALPPLRNSSSPSTARSSPGARPGGDWSPACRRISGLSGRQLPLQERGLWRRRSASP